MVKTAALQKCESIHKLIMSIPVSQIKLLLNKASCPAYRFAHRSMTTTPLPWQLTRSQNDTHNFADTDGQFRRKPSAFRNFIKADPSSGFPAEKDRYVLYIHKGCPWAHRTNIVRSLKGLENVIQLVVFDSQAKHTGGGWCMSGKPGFEKEPVYGFKTLKELYLKANPDYDGRVLVPALWDKKKGN